MFENIGGKIKGMAKFFFWAGTILFEILAIICFINSSSHPESILQGLIYLIAGPIISWLGSLTFYGFGELIERTKSIDEKLNNRYSDPYDIPDDFPIDPSWNQSSKRSSRNDD